MNFLLIDINISWLVYKGSGLFQINHFCFRANAFRERTTAAPRTFATWSKRTSTRLRDVPTWNVPPAIAKSASRRHPNASGHDLFSGLEIRYAYFQWKTDAGATILSIMTLGIMGLFTTLSITKLPLCWVSGFIFWDAECHCDTAACSPFLNLVCLKGPISMDISTKFSRAFIASYSEWTLLTSTILAQLCSLLSY